MEETRKTASSEGVGSNCRFGSSAAGGEERDVRLPDISSHDDYRAIHRLRKPRQHSHVGLCDYDQGRAFERHGESGGEARCWRKEFQRWRIAADEIDIDLPVRYEEGNDA